MTLGAVTTLASPDDLKFDRMVMTRSFLLVAIPESYAQGLADGDALGFMRGIGAARVVPDPTDRFADGFRTGMTLTVPSVVLDAGVKVTLGASESDVDDAYDDGRHDGLRTGLTLVVPSVVFPSQVVVLYDDSDDAYEDGRSDGFRIGLTTAAASSGGGGSEVVLPTVTIVSPTPGVAPGAPGGFPGDFAAAIQTAIVLQMSDASGLGAQVVTARFRNYPRLGGEITEVVYAMGSFVSNYVALSSQISVAGVLTLTCRRDGGWPIGTGVAGDITWTAIAVDTHGNVT